MAHATPESMLSPRRRKAGGGGGKKRPLELVVLVKQVPATESAIEIASDGLSVRESSLRWIVNPYDEFAVEEALRVREDHGGTVTVLSLGPARAKDAIRTAMAMGADRGILICDPAADRLDGLGVARVLAAVLKTLEFDLVLSGQRAVDDDEYLVGTAVAELVGIPSIPLVVEEEIEGGRIRCRRTIDGGTLVVEAPLPALLTTQRGLNVPRYASLPGIRKARQKPLATMTLADLGLDPQALGPMARRTALRLPPARDAVKLMEGESAAEKAAALVGALREEAKVL